MRSEAFVASDGVRLHWRVWEATAPPRATMLILHGVGEYCDRYDALARELGDSGIVCYAFDHRGHGASGGHRAHVDRWERYEADVEEFLEGLLRSETDLPVVVYGHSMGSLICLTLGAKGRGRGLAGFLGWIVSGASIRPTGIAKPWMVAVARLLSRVAPRVALNLRIVGAAVSHDPGIAARYDEDPRIERKATVRWGTEALDAIAFVKDRASSLVDPMLVLHGGADPLSEAAGSRWLVEAAGGDPRLIVYEEALHEPHNDPGYADVAADISRWIDDRLSS